VEEAASRLAFTGKETVDGSEISANLAARSSLPVSYTLTTTLEGLSEEKLNEYAEQFIEQ